MTLPDESGPRRSSGGVQSVERSFELLEHIAAQSGQATLSDLATASGLPLATIHRLVRTLVALGYLRQEPSRRYALGPRLIHLGEGATRLLGSWARPYLAELVRSIGETANLAVLDGDAVVYVAQAPSLHSMRMFTEVGRRVNPHCTGVGKALLAQLSDAAVDTLLNQTGMASQTVHTITTRERMSSELAEIRRAGYAIDDGEQEIGVRCVAVHLTGTPTLTALSVSGPSARMTDELVRRAVPQLRDAAERLSRDLGQERDHNAAVSGAHTA